MRQPIPAPYIRGFWKFLSMTTGLVLTIDPHPWQFVAIQSLTLGVATLVVEFMLRKAADKIPWLPSDNSLIPPPPPDRP